MVIAGIVLIVAIVVRGIVRMLDRRSWKPLARMLLGIAAVAGLYSAWFYVGWGWGYNRAPVQDRVRYDRGRLNHAGVARLRARAIAEMNRLAPLAHAAHRDNAIDLEALHAAWLPVVQRLGDTWTPQVSHSKISLAGWFMDRNGTSGFTNPFTLETQLAPDLLWFERPFDQAHEWSHAAGYNREDEANYIAALTCLRDRDPVARYSGWLEVFLYLPPLKNYPHRLFVSPVWDDFAALRARNAHFINVDFSRFSWRFYNRYLKSNHIAAGVENYNAVTQLLAAIPLDRRGLPIAR